MSKKLAKLRRIGPNKVTDGRRSYQLFNTVVGSSVNSLLTLDENKNLIPVTEKEPITNIIGELVDRIGFSSTSSTTLRTGVKAVKVVPFSCTISAWYIESSVSVNVEVDVYSDLQSPVSIVGAGTKPNLTASSSEAGLVEDWDTQELAEGEILTFEIQAGVTATNVVMTLDIIKT